MSLHTSILLDHHQVACFILIFIVNYCAESHKILVHWLHYTQQDALKVEIVFGVRRQVLGYS
jgi:hypothetical protein